MLGAGIGCILNFALKSTMKDAAKQSVNFKLWKAATKNMTNYDLGLQDVTMTFKSATTMTLRLRYRKVLIMVLRTLIASNSEVKYFRR